MTYCNCVVYNKNIPSIFTCLSLLVLCEQSNCYCHYRHAALMALSAVGEGCHKQMEALLPQIMDGVLSFLQDPVSTFIVQ